MVASFADGDWQHQRPVTNLWPVADFDCGNGNATTGDHYRHDAIPIMDGFDVSGTHTSPEEGHVLVVRPDYR